MFSIVLIVSLLHSGNGNQYTYSSRLSITKEERVTQRVRLKSTRKLVEEFPDPKRKYTRMVFGMIIIPRENAWMVVRACGMRVDIIRGLLKNMEI